MRLTKEVHDLSIRDWETTAGARWAERKQGPGETEPGFTTEMFSGGGQNSETKMWQYDNEATTETSETLDENISKCKCMNFLLLPLV